jgi:hypothetical protein
MVQLASWVSKYLPLKASYFCTVGSGSPLYEWVIKKPTEVVTDRLPVAASNHDYFGVGTCECFLGDGSELHDVLLANLVRKM